MDNKIDSLGLLEVRGLVAGIEAADAMVKTARVRLLRQHQVDPGLISLIVEGDLAACRAAVDAGAAAARRIGEVISQKVIGSPDLDTGLFVLQLAERGRRPFGGESPDKQPTSPVAPAPPVTPAPPAAMAPKTPEAAPVTSSISPSAPALPEPQMEVALTEVLEFIRQSARGVTWKEISGHFPALSADARKELDSAVQKGVLVKVAGRYRGNPQQRPSPKKDKPK